MRVIIENRMNISQAEFDTLIAIFEKASIQEIFQVWSHIQENKDLEEEDRLYAKREKRLAKMEKKQDEKIRELNEQIKERNEQIKERNKRIEELRINISAYQDKIKEPDVQLI